MLNSFDPYHLRVEISLFDAYRKEFESYVCPPCFSLNKTKKKTKYNFFYSQYVKNFSGESPPHHFESILDPIHHCLHLNKMSVVVGLL